MTANPHPFFEIHTFHDAYWLCAGTVGQAADARAKAERMVSEKVGGGVRLVRCLPRPEYDYVARSVLSLRPTGPDVPDPLAPLVFPDRVGRLCQTPADLRSDPAREILSSLLGRWLDAHRVAPLELLHSDIHASRLYDSGVILQGALQKAAVAQVRNTDIPVQKRYRELMALADAVLAELRDEARKPAPPALQEGEWGDWCRSLAAMSSGPAFRFQQFRALASWLLPAKTWLAKLDLLGRLVEPDLPERDLMPVDALFAEIIAAPAALPELAGRDSDRLDQILALIALADGRLEGMAGHAGGGLPALARLTGTGRGPRARNAIRQRFLAELANPAPLCDAALQQRLEALATIRSRILDSPFLAEDAELHDALERRALRALTPEGVQGSMAGLSRASDRLAHLVTLAKLIPHARGKARIMEFARGIFSVEDLIREGGGSWDNRAAAIPLLAGTYRRIAGIETEDPTRSGILDQIDAGLHDLVRREILNAPNRSYLDRILDLIKLCGASPFPPGRARTLVNETIARALGNPDFLKPFLDRLRTEAERRQALISIRDMLLAAGFGRGE